MATQQTDPSLFADIKNQVIAETAEKRETSGSPVVKKKGKRETERNNHPQLLPPRPNKLDRASIAKGHKVPLPMSSVAFGNTSDILSGGKHSHSMTFEAALNARKKHLAALYQNALTNI